MVSISSVEETQQGGNCVGSSLPILPTKEKVMNNSTSFRLNSGEIPINFNGEDLVLRPTLRAATTISRQFDGFANARQALVRENHDAVVFILRLGLNLSDRDARDLPEKVYENGITAELLIPLIKYVAVLGNGGRPLPDEPEDNNNNLENKNPND